MHRLRVLDGREMVESTQRREFLHALMGGAAGPAAPLWLREGLVEAWNGDAREADRSPAIRLDGTNPALSNGGQTPASRLLCCA